MTKTLLYKGPEGSVEGDFIIGNETLWANRQTMADIFNVSVENIRQHLKNIFDHDELNKNSVCKKILYTSSDGKNYNTYFYNLDAIIAVGYRVGSKEGTHFRKWSNKILKEYMVKGFVLDIDLLKNGNRFGKDYFDELLEQIREIRASERRFNQKISDIYTTSYDYEPNAEITREFFATVQNKLIYAVSGKTAAELIVERSDSEKSNMGLTSWKNPNGKILISDVVIAKNYLNKIELERLNRTVDGFLTLAENRAENHIPTSMAQWREVLISYIKLNQLPELTDKGKITSDKAKEIAKKEYYKFRPIQDKTFVSDFDKMINEIKRIEGE
ncbi:virulence RhuM family protein [Methanobrevibacter sp. OttesenSCG-928-K11]|nr:virulence RhuM family protein [Methanobrevibacter sp. OttesenSCG-928-K11]